MQMLTTLVFWLWAAQILLAVAYGTVGTLKTVRPIPDLAAAIRWPADVPVALVRFIGFSEALAAVGMILPVLTGILPWLTPLAAICLSIIQVLAIGFHAQRGETAQTLPMNLILLSLSAFVAWGLWPAYGS